MEKDSKEQIRGDICHRGRFTDQLPFLLILAGIFFFNFASRVSIGPLLVEIESDLGIGHAEAGSLFLIVSVGYCMSLLGSGFISSRITHKSTILMSCFFTFVAILLISASGGLYTLRSGMILLGLATGLYLPSGIATLTAMVKPMDWGKAISVHELAPNLGFVAAPLLAELLLRLGSWRSALMFVGFATATMGVVFWRFAQCGQFYGAMPQMSNVKRLVKTGSFWSIMPLFALGIGASLGVYTMLPTYLTAEVGLSRSTSNFLISASRVSGIGVALLSGVMVDRIGATRTIFYSLVSCGICTTFLGICKSALCVIPFVFLQPLTAVCFFPAGFAALSLVGPPEVRNISVSLTIPVAFLFGGGAVPAFIGKVGEIRSLGIGMLLVGLLITTGAICFWSLGRRRLATGDHGSDSEAHQ